LDVDLLGSIQICTLLDGVQQECVSGAEIAILSVAGTDVFARERAGMTQDLKLAYNLMKLNLK
jgi:hypothetical protein